MEGQETFDTIRARVREEPLAARLARISGMIAEMCKEKRPPKMSLPVNARDEDVFITTTVEDAAEALGRGQFLLFAGRFPHPAPGWGNFRARLRSIVEGEAQAATLGGDIQWWQIVDLDQLRVVRAWNEEDGDTKGGLSEDVILAAIGSTESSTFGEFCGGLGAAKPATGDREAWRALFTKLRMMEADGLVKLEQDKGNIVSMILTKEGADRVRAQKDTGRGLFGGLG